MNNFSVGTAKGLGISQSNTLDCNFLVFLQFPKGERVF